MALFYKNTLVDDIWAGKAFMVPPSALGDRNTALRRYYTPAANAYVDTTLGGHWVINPYPQFTENCDLTHRGVFSGGGGRGRYWYEVLNLNQQVIHIRCGVPKFNSMTSFFANFYNAEAGLIARTGRADSIWFNLGKLVGTIVAIPFMPFIIAGQAIKFLLGMPRTKYYYHKPTMYPYWVAVSSLVTNYMTNTGMTQHFPRADGIDKSFFDPLTTPTDIDLKAQGQIFNEVILKEGAVDVFSIATRAQRLSNEHRKIMDQAMAAALKPIDKMAPGPKRDEARSRALAMVLMDPNLTTMKQLESVNVIAGKSLEDYEKAYLDFSGKKKEADQSTEQDETNDEGWVTKAGKAFDAERQFGADFVSIRVQNQGTQSESFSNSVGQSGIQETINSTSSKARSARFNFADGNLGFGTDKIIGAVSEVVAGTLEGISASGLMALAGNAFTDIQKVYESSSSSLMTSSFTVQLRANNGHPWTILKDVMYPLYCIMAFCLPRATGPQSYDSPFLLELYNQGFSQIREGLCTSLSITRGTGDVGWTKDRKALNIDVTFEITDLSQILSIPINSSTGMLPKAAGILGGVADKVTGADGALSNAVDTAVAAVTSATYSEDTKLTDYQAVLAGLNLDVQINASNKWKLAMARTRANLAAARSPDRWMSKAFNDGWPVFGHLPGDIVRLVSDKPDR